MTNSIQFVCYRATKKSLYEAIRPCSQQRFSELITPIISDIRGVSTVMAKQVSRLNSNEVLHFIESVGLESHDFGKLIIFKGLQVSKKEITDKIPHLNFIDFETKLNPIIARNRRVSFHEVKWVRYVDLSELRSFLFEIGEIVEIDSEEVLVLK
ncbi:hypothetical protein ACFSQJ_15940 [Croceitalea marina]|uniref:Uncharacterized protein n=1 Tax=Croceitalea marina TaxID=1775166 RepID=A0ABW5N2I5_9FLAO